MALIYFLKNSCILKLGLNFEDVNYLFLKKSIFLEFRAENLELKIGDLLNTYAAFEFNILENKKIFSFPRSVLEEFLETGNYCGQYYIDKRTCDCSIYEIFGI